MPQMPRDVAARLGRETVAILRSGHYVSPAGTTVRIGQAVSAAREGTVEYPPDVPIDCDANLGFHPEISVVNESVLDVGRRLARDGPIAALNFAAPEAPGGGFLNGAQHRRR